MITVFNSQGGADVTQCGISIPGFITNGVSGNSSNFMGPVPFRLPPSDGKTYDMKVGGYGLVGEEIPIGYLMSSDIPAKFKPCRHLNANGTIALKPSTGFPNFGSGAWNNFGSSETYLAPSISGPVVKQFSGYPTPSGAYRYWRRNGTIASTSNTEYYNRIYCGLPMGNTLPVGGIPYRFGMRVFWRVLPNTFSQRYMEYCLNLKGFTPMGFSFEGDYADRNFTASGEHGWYYTYFSSFVGAQIRGNTNGTFQIFGSFYSITKYFYRSPSGVVTNYPDKVVESTSWRTLHIVKPGDVPTTLPTRAIAELNNHLAHFGARASSYQSADEMAVARNKAIADITALKSNNLENIAGLKGSLSIFATLLQGAAAVKAGNLKLAAKALASAYLWYSYALAPTISDSKDIAENTQKIVNEIAVNPFSNERRRGRVSTSRGPGLGDMTYVVVYHTRLKDYVFPQLYEALQRFGLHPSLKQGWDFVPLSFVIDWFTGVGPTLEKIDNYMSFTLNRDIEARMESLKAIDDHGYRFSDTPDLFEFVGAYEEIFYNRTVHSGVGPMDPFVGQTLSGNRSSQVLQGASLLIQQLKD